MYNVTGLGTVSNYRRDFDLVQYDSTFTEARRWGVSNAFPVRFKPFSDLNATGNDKLPDNTLAYALTMVLPNATFGVVKQTLWAQQDVTLMRLLLQCKQSGLERTKRQLCLCFCPLSDPTTTTTTEIDLERSKRC